MYDTITCHEPLLIPEGLKFLKLDWRFELFTTKDLSCKCENYLIYNKKLYKQKNNFYEEINYHGFLYFYTHFFDEQNTHQMHVSYLAEFDKGVLQYILLNNFKEYNLEKENTRSNFFLTVFNLFKNYLNK